MLVYLVRHGEAKAKEVDPQRGLTEAGRREAKAVARTVARAAPDIRHIWHSGKRRAAETAAIFAEALAGGGSAPAIHEHAGLNPDDPVTPVAEELASLDEDVALIGHLPFLDRLTALMVGLDARSNAGIVEFKPSATLCLKRTEERWRILWFVNYESCFP
jgi:phosphohistidine phosphatase